MWYVIRTEPGQEESVRRQVRDRMSGDDPNDCKVLYRACKKRYLGAWHDEKELFLPGYLFWVAKDSKGGWKHFHEMLETAGIIRQDGIFNSRELSPVEKNEEEFLKRITGEKDEIGMSYGVIRNGVLKISQGAMVGMEDRVKKIDRHKRKGYIRVRLDDEERVAEIGLEITEKIYFMGNMSRLEENCIKEYSPGKRA